MTQPEHRRIRYRTSDDQRTTIKMALNLPASPTAANPAASAPAVTTTVSTKPAKEAEESTMTAAGRGGVTNQADASHLTIERVVPKNAFRAATVLPVDLLPTPGGAASKASQGKVAFNSKLHGDAATDAPTQAPASTDSDVVNLAEAPNKGSSKKSKEKPKEKPPPSPPLPPVPQVEPCSQPSVRTQEDGLGSKGSTGSGGTRGGGGSGGGGGVSAGGRGRGRGAAAFCEPSKRRAAGDRGRAAQCHKLLACLKLMSCRWRAAMLPMRPRRPPRVCRARR